MPLHPAEQGGRVIIQNKQGPGFMGCSCIQVTGLANLGRNSVCRETVLRPQTWGEDEGRQPLCTLVTLTLDSTREALPLPPEPVQKAFLFSKDP